MEEERLENALRSYYRRERRAAATSTPHRKVVAEMAAAAAEASAAAVRDVGAKDLLRAAAKFSPRAFWTVPVAAVVLACALALSGAPAHEAEAALVVSGPVLVAACLAGVVRARLCLMQELEASCVNNAVALACARLAVFGGATLLALAFVCFACSAVVPAGAAAAYALAPYLVSAAGGLMLARTVSSGDAAVAALAWSAGVCALCVLLRLAVPAAFGAAAVWTWTAVAAVGALWCVREVRGWLRLCAQGGIVLEKPARASVL